MTSKITADSKPLVQSYTPGKILHREKELDQLSACFMKHINIFIYGSHGSGKTLMTKHAIDNFNAKRGRVIYIDCSLYQTTNSIFHEILLSLNQIVSSKSNYALTKRLKSRMRRLNSSLIICLDHFDHLKEMETLNRILSLGLGLFIISEKPESYRTLKPRAKANITNQLQIKTYTLDQTFDILMERARLALQEYTYTEETIRKIADACQGDITLGINLLTSLALKVESKGKKSIDEVEFDYEVDCGYEDLNQDQKIIMKILEEKGSLPSGKLYDLYKENMSHPKSQRSFRIYMRELNAKGLVRRIGKKKGRIYEIVEQPETIE